MPENLNTKIKQQLTITHRSGETAAYCNMDDILLHTEYNMMIPHAGRHNTHIFTHKYLKQKYSFHTELDFHGYHRKIGQNVQHDITSHTAVPSPVKKGI